MRLVSASLPRPLSGHLVDLRVPERYEAQNPFNCIAGQLEVLFKSYGCNNLPESNKHLA